MRQRRPMRTTLNKPQYLNQASQDQHSIRLNNILKTDLAFLQEQNSMLKAKCKKLNQLQQKVQLVLKQNNQLLAQNQMMSRLLHQQKSQTQTIKNKYNEQTNNRYGALSEYQFKQKKLIAEIQNLNSEIRQLQSIKNIQVNQIKNQYQIDISTLKKQHMATLDTYQKQIRTLKQFIDRKQLEILQTQKLLKRHTSESEYEILRTKQQKQHLNQEIIYLQSDYQKSMEQLKQRLDIYHKEQIQKLKRYHNQSYQSLQKDNLRLKDLIDRLTIQLQTIKLQKSQLTNYYQNTTNLLMRQKQELKISLMDLQKLSQSQKIYLQNQLHNLHKKQTIELQQIHNQHIRKLQNQIISLQNTNINKSNEIQQLIREKSNARTLYDNQNIRFKQEIQIYQEKINELENILNLRIKSLQTKIIQKDNQIMYLDRIYKQMKENTQSQIASLKQILSQKKIQLQKYRLLCRQTQQISIQQKNSLSNQKQFLKEALKREQKEKQIQKQNLQSLLNQTENNLRLKIESLLDKINMITKQNDSLKKNITLKEKQITGLRQRVNECQDKIKKGENQINQYRQKIINKDKRNNQLLEQQKAKIQKSNNYILQNMKKDYQASLRLQNAKQKQLRDKLLKKQKQLQNLLKMHKKMTDQVKTLTQQQANKKNIDLKFPGASTDLITNKNIFDVYLKTKVLDLCSDVREMSKQNLQQ